MKRVTAVLIAGSFLLVLTAGVALAATLVGSPGPDTIQGTSENDVIDGRGGDDNLRGGYGSDRIYGGYGDDFVKANDDGQGDYVDCGPGRDTVDRMPTVVPDGAPTDFRPDVYVNCEQTVW